MDNKTIGMIEQRLTESGLSKFTPGSKPEAGSVKVGYPLDFHADNVGTINT